MGYAVYHTEKGKSSATAIGAHIDRTPGHEHSYRNADSSLRGLNQNLLRNRFTVMPLQEAIKTRMAEGYTGKKAIRKDAVKYLKHVVTGSHEEMMKIAKDEDKLNSWVKANYDFMCNEFGKENIVRFTMHLDEKTPHIHIITVPITEDGRLSAKHFLGNPKAMSERQDRYAVVMKEFRLKRGIKGTGIEHETAKQYYGRIAVLDKEIILKANKAAKIVDRVKINPLRIKAAKSDLKAEISDFFKREGIVQAKEVLTQNEALRRQNKAVGKTEAYAKLVATAHEIKQSISLLDYFTAKAETGELRFDGRKGNEYYFGAPGQFTGSIAVNPQKGLWIDYSSGEGGDILTAEKVYQGRSFADAVRHLSGQQEHLQGVASRIMKPVELDPKLESNSNESQITAVFDRVNHPALRKYVRGRGLDPDKDLQGMGKEVHASRGDKNYFYVGFPSEKGGYVLRNGLGFKGNIGPVGASLVKVNEKSNFPGEKENVKIFEGWFDFYSYKKLNPIKKFIGIILNGVANLQSMIPKLKEYAEKRMKITTYLDNDDAGRKTTQKLQAEIPGVKDGSNEYQKFNDLNEFLVEEGKSQNRGMRM